MAKGDFTAATASQLRILANEWRNFAEHSRKLTEQQLELGVRGSVSLTAMIVTENAKATATMLDERADVIEHQAQLDELLAKRSL